MADNEQPRQDQVRRERPASFSLESGRDESGPHAHRRGRENSFRNTYAHTALTLAVRMVSILMAMTVSHAIESIWEVDSSNEENSTSPSPAAFHHNDEISNGTSPLTPSEQDRVTRRLLTSFAAYTLALNLMSIAIVRCRRRPPLVWLAAMTFGHVLGFTAKAFNANMLRLLDAGKVWQLLLFVLISPALEICSRVLRSTFVFACGALPRHRKWATSHPKGYFRLGYAKAEATIDGGAITRGFLVFATIGSLFSSNEEVQELFEEETPCLGAAVAAAAGAEEEEGGPGGTDTSSYRNSWLIASLVLLVITPFAQAAARRALKLWCGDGGSRPKLFRAPEGGISITQYMKTAFFAAVSEQIRALQMSLTFATCFAYKTMVDKILEDQAERNDLGVGDVLIVLVGCTAFFFVFASCGVSRIKHHRRALRPTGTSVCRTFRTQVLAPFFEVFGPTVCGLLFESFIICLVYDLTGTNRAVSRIIMAVATVVFGLLIYYLVGQQVADEFEEELDEIFEQSQLLGDAGAGAGAAGHSTSKASLGEYVSLDQEDA